MDNEANLLRNGEKGMFKEELSLILKQLLSENYAYYMLQSRLLRVNCINNITLVTGSSYAVHGVLDGTYPFICNLSGASQDIFCSYELAKVAIEKRKMSKLKMFSKNIIILGYYALFDDLSLHKRTRELMRTVYAPIIKTSHNYSCDEYDRWKSVSDKFGELTDEQKENCDKYIFRLLDNKNYFNDIYCREDNVEEKYKGFFWDKADVKQKEELAIDRTSYHNKMLKYNETCDENVRILDAYFKMLYENHIKPVVIVPPFTKEYLKYLDVKFKERLEKILEETPYEIDYYDFNQLDDFNEEDFFDMDHLNDTGAAKFTNYLGKIILDT